MINFGDYIALDAKYMYLLHKPHILLHQIINKMAENRRRLKRSGHEILSDSSDDEFVMSSSSYSKATKVTSSITTRSPTKPPPTSDTRTKAIIKEPPKTTTPASLTENIVFESIKKIKLDTTKEPVARAKTIGNQMKHNGTRHAVARMFQSYPRFKSQTLTFGGKTKPGASLPPYQGRSKNAYDRKVRLDKKYAFDKSYKRIGFHVFKSPSSATKKGKQDENNSSNESKMPATTTSRLARKYHPPTKTINLHDTKPIPKCFKKEFPFGSIVQISGPTLDAERWE